MQFLPRLPAALIVVLVVGIARTASQVAAMTIASLRCEDRHGPLGVDVAAPRLSWALVSEPSTPPANTPRGAVQAAYQILVASTPDLLAHHQGDRWDSGKVASGGGQLGKRHEDFNFGPKDFRLTVGRDRSLYAFCMTVPAPGSELSVTSLGTDAKLFPTPIKSVALLGSQSSIQWAQKPDGLAITCPSRMPVKTKICFRIQ